MTVDWFVLIGAALITALAFFFQRITGFGSSMLAAPLLALFWLPHYGINLLLIFQWIFGIALIGKTWRRLTDPNVSWFLVLFLPSAAVGAYILPGLSIGAVRLFLAVVVIIVLLQWLFIPEVRMPRRWIRPAAVIIGLVSGLVHGALGLGGAFFLAYYGSVEKRASHIRDATIATFFLANMVRFPVAVSTAQMSEPVLIAAALAVLPFILGMYLGEKLTHRLDDRIFRYALISILAVAAVNLLLR